MSVLTPQVTWIVGRDVQSCRTKHTRIGSLRRDELGREANACCGESASQDLSGDIKQTKGEFDEIIDAARRFCSRLRATYLDNDVGVSLPVTLYHWVSKVFYIASMHRLLYFISLEESADNILASAKSSWQVYTIDSALPSDLFRVASSGRMGVQSSAQYHGRNLGSSGRYGGG